MRQFRFPLKPVLRVETVQLAEALADHRQLESLAELAEQARVALVDKLRRQEDDFQQGFRRNPRDTVLLASRRQLRAHGEQMLEQLELRRRDIESMLEASSQRISGHRREIARLEKIQDRQLNEYHDVVKRYEQSVQDELSLGRFHRAKEA